MSARCTVSKEPTTSPFKPKGTGSEETEGAQPDGQSVRHHQSFILSNEWGNKLRSQRVCFCMSHSSETVDLLQSCKHQPGNKLLFLAALLSVTISFYALPNKHHGACLSPPSSSRLAGSLTASRTGGFGRGLQVWHRHNVGGDKTTLWPTTWLNLARSWWALLLCMPHMWKKSGVEN